MTELSTRARAACDALRADGASDAERDRVRTRLSALGVAMTVGAGAAMAAGTASAATSAAGIALTSSAPAALPASSLATSVASQTFAGGALSAKGALVGAAGASKLFALPVAIKAGLAVIAVTSALAAPQLFSPSKPAPRAPHSAHTSAASKALPTPRRTAEHAAESERPRTTQLAEPARIETTVRIDERPAPALATLRKSVNAGTRTSAASSVEARDSAPEPSSESTLAAESALLETALSALRSGRAERARELLSRHEETHGTHALLALERERMRRELSHLLR